MEVVSNSRANPVNRIMGQQALFDFLPSNIVNPKCLKELFRKELSSLPKSHILGRNWVWYSLHVQTKGAVEQWGPGEGHVSLDIVTYRVVWTEAKTCSNIY